MSIINKVSSVITKDASLGAARAMLYGAKYKKEDFDKAQIGISTMWYESNPCNNHLLGLAQNVGKSVNNHKYLKSAIFNTIGVSDGISMGTSGMRYSLPSRELIADSIETQMRSMYYDGGISIPGCDKNIPGAIIGLARVNRPSLIIYGGSIKPGNYKGNQVDVVSAFQSYGELLDNKISENEREELLKCCCPGSGSCGGMYTANTMAVATEAMGFALPYSSSNPAVSEEKAEECQHAPTFVYNLLKNNIKPSDIITKKSIENAIVTIITLGGSTNAVLHFLAIARCLKINLDIYDFNKIGEHVPIIGNLKPSGKYLMHDIYENGGLPLITKLLLEQGLIDGDCMTVTGQTVAENVRNIETDCFRFPDEVCNNLGSKILKTKDLYLIKNPLKKTSHICIFNGNFAPGSAVGKITGKEGERFEGFCKVFNSEVEFEVALKNEEIKENTAIIIRYQGPKGGPGMPEMLKSTSLIAGKGLLGKVAFLTDGRFSGGSHGFIIGLVTPEAYDGGPIAMVKDGDEIVIDAVNKVINLKVDENEMKKRYNIWINEKHYVKDPFMDGYLKKFRILVKPASEGCITF
jgi:dihydroxy-acid dehydratase